MAPKTRHRHPGSPETGAKVARCTVPPRKAQSPMTPATLDTPPAPRRKLNLSPEEIERRTRQIVPYSNAGARFSVESISPEDRKRYCAMGGAAARDEWRALKDAVKPDSAEHHRKNRRKIEAKAGKLREALVNAAETGAKVDVRTITAAIRTLETEIETLWRREREIEGGSSGGLPATRKTRVSLAHSAPSGADADPASIDPATLADR